MEWILIIFTAMPNVAPKLQEIVVWDCPALVAQLEPTYEANPDLAYNMRCEKRRRPKKEETK